MEDQITWHSGASYSWSQARQLSLSSFNMCWEESVWRIWVKTPWLGKTISDLILWNSEYMGSRLSFNSVPFDEDGKRSPRRLGHDRWLPKMVLTSFPVASFCYNNSTLFSYQSISIFEVALLDFEHNTATHKQTRQLLEKNTSSFFVAILVTKLQTSCHIRSFGHWTSLWIRNFNSQPQHSMDTRTTASKKNFACPTRTICTAASCHHIRSYSSDPAYVRLLQTFLNQLFIGRVS